MSKLSKKSSTRGVICARIHRYMRLLSQLLLSSLIIFFSNQMKASDPQQDKFCFEALTQIEFRDKLWAIHEKRTDAASQEAVRNLLEATHGHPEHLKIFGDVLSDEAGRIFRTKLSALIDSFEKSEIENADVKKSIQNAYGETLSELGVNVIQMEDTPMISTLWRQFFAKKNIKLAQADRGEELKFWIDCANPETTYLFLDAKIYGQIIGPEIAQYALNKGLKKVYMASDEPDLNMPPGVINIQKMPMSAIEIIQRAAP